MQVVPLTSFVHGSINAVEGHPIEIADGTAADLERAGLVRIRLAPDKAVTVGKPEGDGQGQPSPSLPAAPPLSTATLNLSKPGAKGTRKKGR